MRKQLVPVDRPRLRLPQQPTKRKEEAQESRWTRQPCAGCQQEYRVLKDEAAWKDLCYACFNARRAAAEKVEREAIKLQCLDCKARFPRYQIVAGLCLECYSADMANQVIAHLLASSRDEEEGLA